MRVAILNRPREWWPGGDLIEIDARMVALARLGVECEYKLCNSPWIEPRDLAGFDLVHIWHCNFDWSLANFERAKASGLPYVVTPIFYPGLKDLGITPYLQRAAAVLPFSAREETELLQSIRGLHNIVVIPNGTDPAFHWVCDEERSGVCAVIARPDNTKNSVLIEEACKLAGLPYELICGVPAAEMPAIYRRFRVFASASSSERMSLVVGEALCSGCRVLSTTENRGNEWYPGIRTINPNMQPEHVAKIMLASYHAENWDWRPNEAARKLTWDHVSEMTLEVYKRCLSPNTF